MAEVVAMPAWLVVLVVLVVLLLSWRSGGYPESGVGGGGAG